MVSSSLPSMPASLSLQRGTYAPSTPTDLRSPCPILNAFANHGLIPRDGRNVSKSELDDTMREIGLSVTPSFGYLLSNVETTSLRGVVSGELCGIRGSGRSGSSVSETQIKKIQTAWRVSTSIS